MIHNSVCYSNFALGSIAQVPSESNSGRLHEDPGEMPMQGGLCRGRGCVGQGAIA